jgi:CubicO group peptidase (beta-lactamase class C family)
MKLIRFCCLAIVTLQCVYAQDTLIPSDLKAYIKTRVDQGLNPSVAMVYTQGNTVEFFNYGQTQLDSGKPVDEHTVYEIGSISKVFTSIILADEVLKGNMAFKDPIANYLPETVNVPSRNGKQITLIDLATHSSGLPRMPDNFAPADMNNPFADYTVEQLYSFLNNYELPRAIGSQYEYSNLGMGLLGHILELHTNKSYEDLVKERITKPLGMEHTGVVLTEAMTAHLALGYNDQVELTSNWDIPTLAGAGALRSTASDMLKFMKANMATDGSDLSKAMQMSHQIAFTNTSPSMNLGLGWHYANKDSIVWHNGGTGGYRAFAGFVKGTDKAVVVLTNSAFSVDGVGLKQLGQPLDLTVPKKVEFPEEVQLDEATLDAYVGQYQLAPEFIITVTRKEKRMFGQATGQPQFELFAKAENAFFLKAVEASVTFHADDSGKITSMTLHQNGQDMPAQKLN